MGEARQRVGILLAYEHWGYCRVLANHSVFSAAFIGITIWNIAMHERSIAAKHIALRRFFAQCHATSGAHSDYDASHVLAEHLRMARQYAVVQRK